MEQLFPYIIGWTVPTLLGAALGYLVGKVKRLNARDKAIEEGMRCILRAEIGRAYERHVINMEPITVEQRRELDRIWHAYHEGLNANGTGEAMYTEICELQLAVK